ncbi:MAG: Clp protease N-terminal domain-containing protein, partial [Ardenticatenaceae bacterium]
MASRFEKFSERARRVLSLAQEEAQRFKHNYVGTEHILLGLIRETDGVAAKVLANLNVELDDVRSTVEYIIGRGERPTPREIGLTPRAKKVIELAVDEARRLKHDYIGTEHLLIGLMREGEGVAAGVLESRGVSLDKIRAETSQVPPQSQSFQSQSLYTDLYTQYGDNYVAVNEAGQLRSKPPMRRPGSDYEESYKRPIDAGISKGHIVFYVHGGLNDLPIVARRIIRYAEVYADEPWHLIHLAWDTSWGSSIDDNIFRLNSLDSWRNI